jgi:cytochrome bd-type quinol oxidase subunit 2
VTRHVDFVAQLFRIWGAVFGIVGLACSALAGGAAAIVRTSGPVSTGSDVAASVTAATMGLLALLALSWAALHAWIGTGLRRHQPRARLLALGLAVGNLPLFPFGTALGAYACWVLLHNDGRHVFVPTAPPAV